MSLLDVKQLSLSIAGKTICRQLDFTIRAGEIWGILGPNGSGKTTLLHTLAGLCPITSGDIFLRDERITDLSNKTIAKSIGLLFQEMVDSFPQTVWEHCLAARFPHHHYFQRNHHTDHEITQQALQTMELDAYAARKLNSLSGGEKRRLALAAILAQTPDVYLLDEPCNHLDVRYQTTVFRHFHALARQQSKSIVMSLHDVNQAQYLCDYLIMLFADGHTCVGTTAELLTPDHLSRLYQHPMSKRAASLWHAE